MIPNDCIIIGGGSSIRPDRSIPIEELDIWNKIKNSFTIGTNFSYKWFNSTIQLFGDYTFYYSQQDNLKDIPLIIGKFDHKFFNKDYPKIDNNVILINDSKTYHGKESCKLNKYYSFQLIGLASISLAIGLGCRRIFLLGMDATEINGYTHFYEKEDGIIKWRTINRTGVGKFYHINIQKELYHTGNFNDVDELNNIWYKPFETYKEEGIEIYNVSPLSKINIFLKITYEQFYAMLNQEIINQDETRQVIREKIK
ncbi:MAG: hypothetical protein WC516_05940 [Patescibacteria group bacterium]|jgi:hypothetical protein